MIYLTCGLPGSGKSTWARKLQQEKGGLYLNGDAMRLMLHGSYSIVTKIEKELMHVLAKEILNRWKFKNLIIDSTFLRNESRMMYIELARMLKVPVEIHFFNVPIEECLKRNLQRDRVTPEKVIKQMNHYMEPPKPSIEYEIVSHGEVYELGEINPAVRSTRPRQLKKNSRVVANFIV